MLSFAFALDSVLYSYAQILFSNRRWFGAVLVAASFVSPKLGALGLTGVIISNATAWLLKFNLPRIRSGFYGFNGILFGLAYAHFFQLTPFLLALFPIFVFLCFLIAATLENFFAAMFNLPGLSLPFVITYLVVALFLRNYGDLHSSVALHAASGPLLSLPAPVVGYFQSLAIVVFQPSAWAGVVIALGLLAFSRVLSVLAVVGYAACYLCVQWLLPQRADDLMLVAGFNSVLTVIALGGSLIIPSPKSVMLALFSVVMTVLMSGFLAQTVSHAGLPMLVLPFNLVVLGTIYSLKFRETTTELVLLYFLPGSPEENYYYHHSRVARFERFRRLMPDLPFSGEWTVSQGHDGPLTHKEDWKHAWDFVVKSDNGRTYEGSGLEAQDFLCYRLPITSPLDGTVVNVVDSILNNKVGKVDIVQNWGNTVVIDHGDGLYSALSHLEPMSIQVVKGQRVSRGQHLGTCGNSGRSPEPHLHFQFQATDRIGAKTIAHPFGFYIEKVGNHNELRAGEIPTVGAVVQNLRDQGSIRDAFYFALDSKHEWRCDFDGTSTVETWVAKVDITNTHYLESSAGATVAYFLTDHVLYLTNFQGNRKSALYCFYLCAAQVPLCAMRGLTWADRLPLAAVMNSTVRYFSELLLVVKPLLSAESHYRWDLEPDGKGDVVLQSETRVVGRGILGGFRDSGTGTVHVSPDGLITHFEYARGSSRKVTVCRKEAAQLAGMEGQ